MRTAAGRVWLNGQESSEDCRYGGFDPEDALAEMDRLATGRAEQVDFERDEAAFGADHQGDRHSRR